MNDKANKKIVFCLPSNNFSGKFLDCWSNLLTYCFQKNIQVGISRKESCNIYYVRNMCLGADVSRGENQKPFSDRAVNEMRSSWLGEARRAPDGTRRYRLQTARHHWLHKRHHPRHLPKKPERLLKWRKQRTVAQQFSVEGTLTTKHTNHTKKQRGARLAFDPEDPKKRKGGGLTVHGEPSRWEKRFPGSKRT